jgi:hypothetical protein
MSNEELINKKERYQDNSVYFCVLSYRIAIALDNFDSVIKMAWCDNCNEHITTSSIINNGYGQIRSIIQINHSLVKVCKCIQELKHFKVKDLNVITCAIQKNLKK